jgi:recombination protein RecT
MNTAVKTQPNGAGDRGAPTNVSPHDEYKNRMQQFHKELERQADEFRKTLPAHIPLERFTRVLQTAINKDNKLLYADRASLWTAAQTCAQDGLLPDGREAAFVRFWDKRNRIERVQYMPMVFGLLKKIRNSGELSTIVARVVYEGDRFRNWIDDEGEHLEYEIGEVQDQTIVRKVFAMAKLKDGSVEVEVLSPADIEQIRNVSRAKDDGPWVQWWDEMAKKSAIRRLSKRLPMSTDLDDLVRRDDALYDFDQAREEAQLSRNLQPRGLVGKLDALSFGDRGGDDRGQQRDADGDDADGDQGTDAGEQAAASQAAGDDRVASLTTPAADHDDADRAAFDARQDDPPHDQDDAELTEEDHLLAAARSRALEGRRSFDQFYNRLRADQLDALELHVPALMKAAKDADASKKARAG